MLNLNTFIASSRRAAAFGALAIGAIAFSGSATAAQPTQLFPFFMAPQTEVAPQPSVEAAPSEDEGTVYELPARLRRQVVSYATREAPGTVIIDTPNTYLYYVLGSGQALSSRRKCEPLPVLTWTRTGGSSITPLSTPFNQ